MPFKGAQVLPLGCFCARTGAILLPEARRRGFDVAKRSERQLQAYRTAAARHRARSREHGQMGFNDMRTVALGLLEDEAFAARLGAALRSRFTEVVVDEAQDCNQDDIQIMSWLRDSGIPLVVVCDPDQAIYGFRGGVTDQLNAFADTFPAQQRKRLTGNFRSTPDICRAVAQLRPLNNRVGPDDALGPLRGEAVSVRILAYPGTSVPEYIGEAFCAALAEQEILISSAPIVAATKASAAAAAGKPHSSRSNHRTIRLAEAVTAFHCAAGMSDLSMAIERAHKVFLELEGRLGGLTYGQYLVDNEIEATEWRSLVVSLLRALRFEPATHPNARAWHNAAKELLAKQLVIDGGRSVAQLLPWTAGLDAVLAPTQASSPQPGTIHSIKGLEFPSVCVVTTSPVLGGVLDFLESGEPTDRAEDARKLYVAASRAERLLVIAAPRSQAERLRTHLRGQGAEVSLTELPAARRV